jgi:lipoate-protein ligase A
MRLSYINSKPLPGDFNMACDFTLTNANVPGDDALFRLYTWRRPTISLGYHQKAADIDLIKCKLDGIDIVRRPTGGRAILHWGEITYCFIISIEDRYAKKALKDIYRRVHSAILKSVAQHGISIDYSEGRKTSERHHPICFASSAGTELVMEGKKAVGSAQRLINSTVLQHGSILLSDYHLKLVDYLKIEDEKRESLRRNMAASSTHIPLLDRPELRQEIAENIASEFDLKIKIRTLSNEEIKNIEQNCNRFNIKIPKE